MDYIVGFIEELKEKISNREISMRKEEDEIERKKVYIKGMEAEIAIIEETLAKLEGLAGKEE